MPDFHAFDNAILARVTSTIRKVAIIPLITLLALPTSPVIAATADAYEQATRYSAWASICIKIQPQYESQWVARAIELGEASDRLGIAAGKSRETLDDDYRLIRSWASGFMTGVENGMGGESGFCDWMARTWSKDTGWIVAKSKAAK
ncbi:hypothetical protein Aeroheme_01432 [Aeromonas sp. DSM 116730]|uniref:hypothetical protein n=1 Tax=Aeromonas sp. DSM 116730 TaxID=3115851 RepID=UPI003981ED5D